MHIISKAWSNLKRKINSPPPHMLKETTSYKTTLAMEWREILLLDIATWAFMISSINQQAYVFGKGDPFLWDYTKAFGIDFTIWVISKALSKLAIPDMFSLGSKNKYKFLLNEDNRAMKKLLWAGIILLVALTTVVNTLYEFWTPGTPPGYISFTLPPSALIGFTQIISSSFIAVTILFLVVVRQLRQKSMLINFHAMKRAEQDEAAAEERRQKAREATRRWREKVRSDAEKKIARTWRKK